MSDSPLPPDPTPEVHTVSSLNHSAKLLLERGLGRVWVEGEVSNFVRASSGHWYLTLKDERAQVRAAMFSQTNRRQALSPSNGMRVLARAQVSVYEPRGDYQLILEHLEHAGDGLLRQRFEALKNALMAEGLFDAARKRPLPTWPRRIGVITSPTGAAIRDILNILKRRAPSTEVIVYPVPVQGAHAAPDIARMIALADARAEVDVLIVARGGGSLEDLWAFNEEVVARALSDCRLPTLSGVGHEIDYTICDWVADVRAPTPSGAAELATPDHAEVQRHLSLHQRRLQQAITQRLNRQSLALHTLENRLQREHPATQLQAQQQRLDDLTARLTLAMQSTVRAARWRWNDLRLRVHAHNPAQVLSQRREVLNLWATQLHQALRQRLKDHHQSIASWARTLHAVSPLATLERGYGIVQTHHGQVIHSVHELAQHDTVQLTLKDGRLTVKPLPPDLKG